MLLLRYTRTCQCSLYGLACDHHVRISHRGHSSAEPFASRTDDEFWENTCSRDRSQTHRIIIRYTCIRDSHRAASAAFEHRAAASEWPDSDLSTGSKPYTATDYYHPCRRRRWWKTTTNSYRRESSPWTHPDADRSLCPASRFLPYHNGSRWRPAPNPYTLTSTSSTSSGPERQRSVQPS